MNQASLPISTPPARANVVVIGGGVVGCSIAYHLARAGLEEVVLLERDQLGCGTTWHSVGNMETYRTDPLLFELVQYGMSLLPELEAESEQQLGWKTCGRVMFTHLEERMEEYRYLPEIARRQGIEMELLDRQGVRDRMPLVEVSDIVGGLWIPGDGRINPTDLTAGFARAARRRGAKLLQHCPVTRILTQGQQICGVETPGGVIECEHVVLAAGLWSSDLAATCGAPLPMHAAEHFYLITEAIPSLPKNLPMFFGFDEYLYGREEVGGLIIGALDKDTVPVVAADLPNDFSFGLLNERWEQFEPYLQSAMHRFPILEQVRIRSLINGPESFTPDARMLLGPVAQRSGLWVAAGMNSNGIALSFGAGRLLAEWITQGQPSLDVASLDVRRFAPVQAEPGYMRERVTEIVSYCVEMHGPFDDCKTSRNVRLSPLHDYLAEKGAAFQSVGGWERPLYFSTDEHPHREAARSAAVKAELEAADQGVLCFDRSSDLRFLVRNNESMERIASLLGLEELPSAGQAVTAALVNTLGGVDGLVHLACLGPAGFLLHVPPEQETHLLDALARKFPGYAGQLQAETSQVLLALEGHEARALLCDSLEFIARNSSQGLSTGWWNDCSNSACLLLEPGQCTRWIQAFMKTGAHPIRWGGHLAAETLRVRAGCPAFGRELTPFVAVPASDFPMVYWPAASSGNSTRQLRTLQGSVAASLPFGGASMPVFSERQIVGRVTSATSYSSPGPSAVLVRLDASVLGEDLYLLCNDQAVELHLSTTSSIGNPD